MSPKSTAAQAQVTPLPAHWASSSMTTPMRTSCSKIWAVEGLPVFRRAMKYPRRQEEMPMKGRLGQRMRRAGAARISCKKRPAMESAQKKTRSMERTEMMAVSTRALCSIFKEDFLEPQASSSAHSRVTAVEMPPPAKAAANT